MKKVVGNRVVIAPEIKRISIKNITQIMLIKINSDPHFRFKVDRFAGSYPKPSKEEKEALIRSKVFSFLRDGNIQPKKINDPTTSFNYEGDAGQDNECDISVEEFNLFARLYGLDVSNDSETYSSYQPKNEHSTLRSVTVTVTPYDPSGEDKDENEAWDPEIEKAADDKKKARLKKQIPGKMPISAVGKLAVKIAWGLEVDTGKKARSKEVMERLCKLAETANGTDSLDSDEICLLSADTRIPGREKVRWITLDGTTEKWFGQAACEQALRTWRKSITQKTIRGR